MQTQRNQFVNEGSSTVNFALLRFMEQHPGLETALDFITYCRKQGGESYFHARCKELGLDPNELCTSRTTQLSDWAWGELEPAPRASLFTAIG